MPFFESYYLYSFIYNENFREKKAWSDSIIHFLTKKWIIVKCSALRLLVVYKLKALVYSSIFIDPTRTISANCIASLTQTDLLSLSVNQIRNNSYQIICYLRINTWSLLVYLALFLTIFMQLLLESFLQILEHALKYLVMSWLV